MGTTSSSREIYPFSQIWEERKTKVIQEEQDKKRQDNGPSKTSKTKTRHERKEKKNHLF
jgi:hypothetical protein